MNRNSNNYSNNYIYPSDSRSESKSERIKKYIDIDSTYRNRNTNPLQGDFVVQFSTSGQKGSIYDSMDPVVLGFPFETGTLITGSTGTIVLPTTSGTFSNFYINTVAEVIFGTTSIYRKIVAYSGANTVATGTASVDPAWSTSPTGGQFYSIRRGFPITQGNFQAGSTSMSVVLSSTASSLNDDYKGKYLRIRGATGPLYNQIRYITKPSYTGAGLNPQFAYNGTTKVAILNSVLPVAPSSSDSYEILEYSYDNLVPLLYSGSSTMSQPICYRIRLISISIPNQILACGYGGNIDKYPYIYVRLCSDNNKTFDEVIYSNNPNSKLALFKIPISCTYYSGATSFVTLEGPNETQTVKFKPNDTLRFTVTLPNGEIINFSTSDNLSPLQPNPLLQISALFEIERLD